jgi:acetolactate synthase-1/2/3 large subunit
VTVARSIIEALKAENVRYLFGLPGGDSRKMLYDALYDDPSVIKHILVRHPQSAPFMALASSRLTGEPTICHATGGPGVANLFVGMGEAYSSCAPVIALVPSLPMAVDGRGAHHEMDNLSAFKSVTKWAARVEVAQKVPWCLRRAFSIACNGKPGPVYLEFPEELEATNIPPYVPSIRPIRTAGSPERVSEAADFLLKSHRPVIISGGGAISSKAFQEIPELAELLCAPIFTSPTGRGIVPEDHPLILGSTGAYRNEIADRFYGEADLVISVGFRFELVESLKFNWFPKSAKLIQIDIDSFEIGRNLIPDVAIVGDAKLVLRQIIEALKEKMEKKPLKSMPRLQEIIKAKKEYEDAIEKEIEGCTPVSAARVLRDLGRVFGKDTILALENGAVDIWAYFFPFYKMLEMGPAVGAVDGLNCMGAGVAGAIGAKITVPGKKVACITGDGAFQMLMHELPVTVQYKAPVTFIVFNNFALGWVKYGQKVLLKERFIDTDFDIVPDFTKFAESCKCYGEKVEKPDQVTAALKRALHANQDGQSAVLDIIMPSDWWNRQPKAWTENMTIGTKL